MTTGLIHTCSIIKRTATSQNEYGEPVYTETSTSSECRFYFSKTGQIISPGSGDHVKTTPSIILPSTAAVAEGDRITSNETGFSKSYIVTAVKVIPWVLSKTTHHIECELEAVE